MRINRLLICAATLMIATHFAEAQSTYVYVGNYANNSVSGYLVNPATGALTAVPNSPVPAGTNPGWVSLDSQCRFAYVANQYSQNVSAYSVDTNTGTLSAVPGSPFATNEGVPGYLAIDKFGKFLVVPTQGAGGNGTTVSVFAIGGDNGRLTAAPGSPFGTGGVTPSTAAIDSSDRFVYVTNQTSNTVAGFTMDPQSGSLTPIPGSPWSSLGFRPIFVRTDNSGRFLYVTNRSSISVFSIDQNSGALTPLNGETVNVGHDLYYIAFDYTNRFMYVGDNGGGVYGYSVDAMTGALTPIPGSPFQTDSPQGNPVFTTDPATNLFYTSGFGGSNTVSAWRIDPNTGALTQVSRSPSGSYPASIGVCSADAEGAIARLIGNNTFTGDQTVNGQLSATTLVGDGSLITNINPANIAPGTAGINITGSATSAVSAASAAVATNASNLGGVPANNYARLDIANQFNGSQSINTALIIGSGAPIVGHLSGVYNPSIPMLKAGSCSTVDVTLTGATDGDSTAIGVTNGRMNGGNGVLLEYTAWASAADTVTIRACNLGATPQKTATSGNIRVDVWKH